MVLDFSHNPYQCIPFSGVARSHKPLYLCWRFTPLVIFEEFGPFVAADGCWIVRIVEISAGKRVRRHSLFLGTATSVPLPGYISCPATSTRRAAGMPS